MSFFCPAWRPRTTLSARLEAIGNIRSDGRPILGLDSRDLLELTLEACPEAEFIPAHIWTPHFSMFGAFSGFDTIEECFAGHDASYPRGGNGPFVRPADELARYPCWTGCTLVSHSRCTFARKAGPRGRPAGHRCLLPGIGAGHPHRRGVLRHGGIFSGRKANTIWTGTAAAACA